MGAQKFLFILPTSTMDICLVLSVVVGKSKV